MSKFSKRSTWALPYTIFLVLFVALPLIIIILYAFQDSSGNFSLGNFAKFLTDADAIGTFALSLEVAIENTLICILLGYPAAWILANKKLNRSAVTVVLFILPMWINALMRTPYQQSECLFQAVCQAYGKARQLQGYA